MWYVEILNELVTHLHPKERDTALEFIVTLLSSFKKAQYPTKQECGLCKISRFPTNKELEVYENAQYFLIDTKLIYYNKPYNELNSIKINTEQFTKLSKILANNNHITKLSVSQLIEITEITDHIFPTQIIIPLELQLGLIDKMYRLLERKNKYQPISLVQFARTLLGLLLLYEKASNDITVFNVDFLCFLENQKHYKILSFKEKSEESIKKMAKEIRETFREELEEKLTENIKDNLLEIIASDLEKDLCEELEENKKKSLLEESKRKKLEISEMSKKLAKNMASLHIEKEAINKVRIKEKLQHLITLEKEALSETNYQLNIDFKHLATIFTQLNDKSILDGLLRQYEKLLIHLRSQVIHTPKQQYVDFDNFIATVKTIKAERYVSIGHCQHKVPNHIATTISRLKKTHHEDELLNSMLLLEEKLNGLYRLLKDRPALFSIYDRSAWLERQLLSAIFSYLSNKNVNNYKRFILPCANAIESTILYLKSLDKIELNILDIDNLNFEYFDFDNLDFDVDNLIATWLDTFQKIYDVCLKLGHQYNEQPPEKASKQSLTVIIDPDRHGLFFKRNGSPIELKNDRVVKLHKESAKRDKIIRRSITG